jgi:DNA-binding IscR family transcriptional regulator
MTEIARRFAYRLPPATATELAREFRVPARLSGRILGVLTGTGLLIQGQGDTPTYTPLRPLDQITPGDVLQAMRSGIGQNAEIPADSTTNSVRAEFDAIRAAEMERGRQITMAELVAKVESRAHNSAV